MSAAASIARVAFFSDPRCKRAAPLTYAVLLHLVFFVFIFNGLSYERLNAQPEEVMITLVSPQSALATKMPKTEPKQTPVLKQPAPAARPTPSPVPAPVTATAPAIAAAAANPAPAASTANSEAAPAAATAPIPARSQPITVSSVEYIQPPRPEYPPDSKRMGEQGKVLLRILINVRGQPERVEIQQATGFVRLDEAARAAAQRALFKPHMEDGRPVPVYVIVPINFSIK